jgi:23S rRNA pseudouridine1911/1915/1917 synthase
MPVSPSSGAIHLIAGVSDKGDRLDTFVATRMSELSRSQAALLIQNESIKVNDQAKKPGYRIQPGDTIRVVIPPPAVTTLKPEPLALDILYEDDDVILINKAAGMVVHPAPGHEKGTLVNALLHHCPEIGPIGGEMRPGIVHRLDKDTSGLLVIAKNAAAHTHLSAQFAQRSVQKEYQAIVYGDVKEDTGCIKYSIGRHPVDRKRMSIRSRSPRAAETHWRVRERFDGLTLLALDLKTGRTHQARVHCAAIGHAIVGDPMYAGRRAVKRFGRDVYALIKPLGRQMLHARQLAFIHPSQGTPVCLQAPLPDDMKELIAQLRAINK